MYSYPSASGGGGGGGGGNEIPQWLQFQFNLQNYQYLINNTSSPQLPPQQSSVINNNNRQHPYNSTKQQKIFRFEKVNKNENKITSKNICYQYSFISLHLSSQELPSLLSLNIPPPPPPPPPLQIANNDLKQQVLSIDNLLKKPGRDIR